MRQRVRHEQTPQVVAAPALHARARRRSICIALPAIIASWCCLFLCSVRYDRIYVGAGCSTDEAQFFARFLTIGGQLIAPVENEYGASFLRMYRRTASRQNPFETNDLLGVRFAGWRLRNMRALLMRRRYALKLVARCAVVHPHPLMPLPQIYSPPNPPPICEACSFSRAAP